MQRAQAAKDRNLRRLLLSSGNVDKCGRVLDGSKNSCFVLYDFSASARLRRLPGSLASLPQGGLCYRNTGRQSLLQSFVKGFMIFVKILDIQ